MDNEYNIKRINPPIYQHDYHVLSRLKSGLKTLAEKYFPKKNLILVDYGCGSLPYKKLFTPYVTSYIGVDILDNNAADIIIKENERIPLKKASCDVILSTQVLEHVREIDFYLSEIRRLLKPKGILLLSTHGIWPYHPYPTDYHRWTKTGLVKVLQEAGFECLKTESVLGPFASVTQYTLLLLSGTLNDRGILAKLFLTVFSLVGNGIIFLEDKLFPPKENSDASVYIVCAKKI